MSMSIDFPDFLRGRRWRYLRLPRQRSINLLSGNKKASALIGERFFLEETFRR
jgi:hypothetical protein